ncbi:hypothetical protein F5B20DRAFT_590455 [Whalleya microplaca]|nr:hypothetical protein F5B20DRAFT_590455 [Whalleya microplaca]
MSSGTLSPTLNRASSRASTVRSTSTLNRVPSRASTIRSDRSVRSGFTKDKGISLYKGKKHAALLGYPSHALSDGEFANINIAIVKTVDSILGEKNLSLDGLGPERWELDAGFGVALEAEVRRPIKERCSFDDPKLQKELKRMSRDATQKEFRQPYQGGGVWFRFIMIDLHKAKQPIVQGVIVRRSGKRTEEELELVNKAEKQVTWITL